MPQRNAAEVAAAELRDCSYIVGHSIISQLGWLRNQLGVAPG